MHVIIERDHNFPDVLGLNEIPFDSKDNCKHNHRLGSVSNETEIDFSWAIALEFLINFLARLIEHKIYSIIFLRVD